VIQHRSQIPSTGRICKPDRVVASFLPMPPMRGIVISKGATFAGRKHIRYDAHSN